MTLSHISFVVNDIVSAIGTWALHLGVEPIEYWLTPGTPAGRTIYRGSPTTARAKQAVLQGYGMRVELLEPVGYPSTWRDFLDLNGDGLHHLGYWVDNFESACAAQVTAGGKLVQTGQFPGGRTGLGGHYAFFEPAGSQTVHIELLADRHFHMPEGS